MPSGLKATADTGPSCPLRVVRCDRRSPPPTPAPSRLCRAEARACRRAEPHGSPELRLEFYTILRSFIRQLSPSLEVLCQSSWLAVSIHDPSCHRRQGLGSASMSCRVGHSCIRFLSSLADAWSCTSWLKATNRQATSPGGAGLAGRRVPQPHRLVPARGGEGLAVGAEGHRRHPALVPLEGGAGLAGRRVPQPHRRVAACGGEGLAVGAEGHGVHRVLVPLEGGAGLAGRRVPQPHRPVEPAEARVLPSGLKATAFM